MIAPDLDSAFYNRMAEVAQRIASADQDPKEVEARILCVCMSESGVHAAARNPSSEASGLIQFMPSKLQDLGWHSGPENFRRLSAADQVPFVEAYFWPARGKIVSTAAAYVWTFLPADLQLAADPNAVLVQKGGRRSWAFAQNSAFDANGDAKIVVRELDKAIERQCRGPRWEEIVTLSGIGWEVPQAVPFDTLSTLGIQQCLKAFGFDPGPLDGIPGARTRAAVMLFQQSVGLVPDGLVGPLTRRALTDRVHELGLA